MDKSNFPKVFRKAQIEDFVEQMKRAATFLGPDGQEFHDSYIDTVLEEVQADEADLTSARVAIEQYVLTELAKDPGNVMFMRLHDSIQRPIQEVIDIEVLMYGQPRYIVSKANKDASAWMVGGAAELGIQNVSYPQDIATEIAKYGFVGVEEKDYPVLPEEAPDINNHRRSFFAPVDSADEEGGKKDAELDWYKNFENEIVFNFLDTVIYAANFHDQVSMGITRLLEDYLLKGEVSGGKRDEKALEYEHDCYIPEVELTPVEFITTAANSSLRALFTAFQLTSTLKEKFIAFLEKPESIEDHFADYEELSTDEKEDAVAEVYVLAITALVKLFGKHPIFEKDMVYLEHVLDFVNDDLKKHFYVALNDWSDYYEERGFYVSSRNCQLLKNHLAENGGQPEEAKEETPEEEAMEPTKETEKPIDVSSAAARGIYFEP